MKLNIPKIDLSKISLPKLSLKKAAIDWGSSAIKVISASKLKHAYLINDFIYQKVEDDLSSVLSRVWQEKKLPLYNIVLSLDGASTLVRVVDFPRMDKKMIRTSLGFELSRYIPFSQEEAYFDFSILDVSPESPNIKLLIASVKKDFVDEKLNILKEADIVPNRITLSPISLVNAFLKFYPHQDVPVGILDLGFSYSMISIIYKNNIYLSREVRKGVKDILSRLSNILGKEITNFKELVDQNKGIDSGLLSEVSSDLIEEIRLSLDYLETRENLSVKKLYSTGGLTTCQIINENLAQSLGIEVLPFNILGSFSFSSSVKEDLEKMEGNFSVALSTLL